MPSTSISALIRHIEARNHWAAATIDHPVGLMETA
jgi:hypothetical protein